MLTKLKNWLIGSVIMKKVIGKLAKHASMALVGLLSAPTVAPWLAKLGIGVDVATLETALVVAITGLLGAAYNYIQHRFF